LWREVFDGPGVEGLAVLSFEQLSSVPAEQWGRMRLHTAPCLRLQVFGYPLDEYWTTLRSGGQPATPQPRTCYLAVHRRDYVVERHDLTAVGFELLSALAAGGPLEAALSGAARLTAGAEGALQAEVGNWFACWTQHGF